MSFVYLERPAKIDDAPLLLLLHGYGSNEADLFSLASYIPNAYHVVSLQAPIGMGEGYAWFPIHFTDAMERWTNPEEVKKAIQFIESFLTFYSKKEKYNSQPVYMMGFSQGAMLSYAVGLNHENVKGIAALSGYIDPRVVEVSNKNIESIYVSHGTQDAVVPYAWAKQSVEQLKEYGHDPMFYSYAQGHGINQENLLTLMEWLQHQL